MTFGAGALPRRADVVVVGAGSAGCLLARQLCGPARSVLLIEQGTAGPDGGTLSILPVGASASRIERFGERRGRPVMRGTGLGGSSAVNGGYFLRWHPGDLALWPESLRAPLAEAYETLDGGDAGGGLMSVSAFCDDELGDVPRAFEDFWRTEHRPDVRFGAVATGVNVGAWPVVGLNRVRSNRRIVDGDSVRFTAAQAALGGGWSPEPAVALGVRVDEVLSSGNRITGVRAGDETLDCDEVILCAGTLGTASLLQRSGLAPPRLTVYEHAERIVRFDPRRAVRAPALLQAVAHTRDGLEIRCYSDDFARFIDGLPEAGIPIGVVDMADEARGTIGDDGLDLGAPSSESDRRMRAGVEGVVAMLHGPGFAGLVERGSVIVDPVVGMSQHAHGTLPIGQAVDELGALDGVRGLRVVDGSILPAGGRSGPHATVTAAALAIGRQLNGR
ncbi:MAG: mycofactocin system GMC family oxidoreductase MftG [Gordonia sp. (in: high G+C Gram-positive bacteria)]